MERREASARKPCNSVEVPADIKDAVGEFQRPNATVRDGIPRIDSSARSDVREVCAGKATNSDELTADEPTALVVGDGAQDLPRDFGESVSFGPFVQIGHNPRTSARPDRDK
jgi:hypothetical protein